MPRRLRPKTPRCSLWLKDDRSWGTIPSALKRSPLAMALAAFLPCARQLPVDQAGVDCRWTHIFALLFPFPYPAYPTYSFYLRTANHLQNSRHLRLCFCETQPNTTTLLPWVVKFSKFYSLFTRDVFFSGKTDNPLVSNMYQMTFSFD